MKRRTALARPVKWRKIEKMPTYLSFVPSMEPCNNQENNDLLVEEIEAIRLKDLEGLEQSECAKKMEVSRPTFQRILQSAREKIADSIINGKPINIGGGNYTRNICNAVCQDCGSTWKESVENLALDSDERIKCPKCGSVKIGCGKRCKYKSCNKGCCTDKLLNNSEDDL